MLGGSSYLHAGAKQQLNCIFQNTPGNSGGGGPNRILQHQEMLLQHQDTNLPFPQDSAPLRWSEGTCTKKKERKRKIKNTTKKQIRCFLRQEHQAEELRLHLLETLEKT